MRQRIVRFRKYTNPHGKSFDDKETIGCLGTYNKKQKEYEVSVLLDSGYGIRLFVKEEDILETVKTIYVDTWEEMWHELEKIQKGEKDE